MANRSGSQGFQSTHPYGVRLEAAGYNYNQVQAISIHAPVWGATGTVEYAVPSHQDFNPRTRMGCDGFEGSRVSHVDSFQSTHPYGVRRCECKSKVAKIPISIHAPVWGATLVRLHKFGDLDISIHAPVWGATCASTKPAKKLYYFNPRTRMGCDHLWSGRPRRQTDFNPRTRMGCDDS